MVETQALSGDDLEIDHVWAVAVEGASVELSDTARERMSAAREVVERAVASPTRTYGVNTGFGRNVTQTIPSELADELQIRLLRSHACGVGDPYPDEIVRAALLLRANALANGHSGTRVEVAELLLECLTRGVLPRVPSRGSVGASGDLAPLAHLALPLIGEGEAWFEGELVPGGEALRRAGLEPLRLRATELDDAGRRIPNRARLYEITNGGGAVLAPRHDVSIRWPSGGFVSTAEDVARFGSRFVDGVFLRPGTIREFLISQRTADGRQTGYGLGWEVHSSPLGDFAGHTGNAVGGTAAILVHPSSGVAFALATNLGYVTAPRPPTPRPGTPDPPLLAAPFVRAALAARRDVAHTRSR